MLKTFSLLLLIAASIVFFDAVATIVIEDWIKTPSSTIRKVSPISTKITLLGLHRQRRYYA
jgi:hypothetical protein